MSTHLAIVGGTGALGFALAARFAAAGHHTTIGSRSADRAAEAADRVRRLVGREHVDGGKNGEATKDAAFVLLAVPFAAHVDNVKAIREALRPGQIVIEATVPLATALGGRPTRVIGVPQGSAAQQAAELLPDGVHVVSALHTVSASKLVDLYHELDEDVPIAGDDVGANRAVAELIATVRGLRPVNCGPLELAGLIERLTPLLISVNKRNRTHAGVRFTGVDRPAW
jgi:8-hydroxy-5-deazaflavin:NADPH oxidoreductase